VRLSFGFASVALSLTLGAAAMPGCGAVDTDVYLLPSNPGSPGLAEAKTRPDAVRMRRGQLAIEYSPDLDRVTFFGVHNGPNLLHTIELDREPASDGSYTFFGGGYSWIAPQRGEHGWRSESGELQDWPPDPSIDAGPSRIVGRTPLGVVAENPISREGLREEKSIRLSSPHSASIEFQLSNTSDETLRRATWINTAVRPNARIALRLRDRGEVAQLYSSDEGALEILSGILGPTDDQGWAIVDLRKATFDGGIKVYTDGPAEIAVWVPNPEWLQTEGFWMHRSLETPLTVEQRSELRALGEGPVAIYLNPGLGLFEAELYGPVVDLEPGATASSTEVWTVYRASSPRSFLMRESRLLPLEKPGFFEKH